jgi:hypothetical protein
MFLYKLPAYVLDAVLKERIFQERWSLANMMQVMIDARNRGTSEDLPWNIAERIIELITNEFLVLLLGF